MRLTDDFDILELLRARHQPDWVENESTMAEFSHISAENDSKGLSDLNITGLAVQTFLDNSGRLEIPGWATMAAFQLQAGRMNEYPLNHRPMPLSGTGFAAKEIPAA